MHLFYNTYYSTQQFFVNNNNNNLNYTYNKRTHQLFIIGLFDAHTKNASFFLIIHLFIIASRKNENDC